MAAPTDRTIDAIWRMESPKLVAVLTRMTGDIALAEDLCQDILLEAIQHWRETRLPDKPGAWLMTAAKHRAIDFFRGRQRSNRKHKELERDLELQQLAAPDLDTALDDNIGDDLLRLMFIACHPVVPPEARVALTLRLLGGLTTDEIARAFLVAESTVAQRIVRAKRTIANEKVPFDLPKGNNFTERIASVLAVIYLVFNEGYSATTGEDWIRPSLCEEALRLGRILAELAPQEAEAHGLVALMEIQSSRFKARIGPGGEPILLLDQNRARWDQLLIGRGLAALQRAEQGGRPRGPYTLQAAIVACHATARTPEQTDWHQIVRLYRKLADIAPSAIVELNLAVAVAMAFGPASGLVIVDALVSEPSLANYHLLPSVRGDLLNKLGRFDEAQDEFTRAAALTGNERERSMLLKRADSCRSQASSAR